MQHLSGYEVNVWCTDWPSEAARVAFEWDLDNSIRAMPIIGPRQLSVSPATERLAVSDTGRAFDVLHQHSLWTALSRVTNRWRNATRGPTVIAPQGTLRPYAWKRSNWKKRLAMIGYERHNLQAASCLQATAESEANVFRSFGLSNPIAIIPNSVDDAWLSSSGDAGRFCQKYSLNKEKRKLLYLSRVHPIKGLPMLLEALSMIQKDMEDWQVVIAGPNEDGHRYELEALSNKLGITEELVTFTGPLYGTDKRDAFSAARLFVLPSHSENFSIAVIEALGAGVPVITTRGTPWKELLTHRCGWWIDINSMALRTALVEALRCSSHRLAEMGQRGRELVAEKYVWSRTVESSLQLYKWLLGCAPKPVFVLDD